MITIKESLFSQQSSLFECVVISRNRISLHQRAQYYFSEKGSFTTISTLFLTIIQTNFALNQHLGYGKLLVSDRPNPLPSLQVIHLIEPQYKFQLIYYCAFNPSILQSASLHRRELQYFQLLLMPSGLLSDSSASNSQLDSFEAQPQHPVQADPSQQKYYQQFRKIYHTAFKLNEQVRKQTQTHGKLLDRLSSLEAQLSQLRRKKTQDFLQEDLEGELDEECSRRRINRRNRRTAEEIERRFYCPVQYCDRCYGSQGSLQQHLKLKHPQQVRSQLSQSQE